LGNKNELIASVQREIARYEEFLARSTEASELASAVQQKKEEAEARLQALRAVPDDVLDEAGGPLLIRQEQETERIDQTLPVIPKMNVHYITASLNSTGTSSDSEVVARIVRFDQAQTSWYPAFIAPLTRLAESQGREEYLFEAYARLNPDLRKRLQKAVRTARSALGGVAAPDLASEHLRGALQKVWGELCSLARRTCRDVGRKRLELSNPAHRHQVAACLGTKRNNSGELEELLSSLSALYGDLSSAAKDPFQDSAQQLEELFTRWRLHLYNVAQALVLPGP
jgi:hypothetical protein